MKTKEVGVGGTQANEKVQHYTQRSLKSVYFGGRLGVVVRVCLGWGGAEKTFFLYINALQCCLNLLQVYTLL